MNRARLISWGVPLLILFTQFPVFLQLSLTPDTVLYDLQSQCLLDGGVLYRDIVEPNLPGVVWVHTAVRWLCGTSPVALRIFDMVVVLSISAILCSFVTSSLTNHTARRIAQGGLLSSLWLFYFGTSEWCHCQRDTWMLLPCLLATLLRCRAIRLQQHDDGNAPSPNTVKWLFAYGLVEGVFWGLGFWLKPYVAFPAIGVLLTSMMFTSSRKSWALQFLTIVFGGAITGLLGIVWMVSTDCWPYFFDMLTTWNGDYFQAGRSRWTLDRFVAHSQRFWPWILLHCPAAAIAIYGLWAARVRSSESSDTGEVSGILLATLLKGCYLGWIFQAFMLQQLFDYIHVPGIMLAISVCLQAGASRFFSIFQPASSTLTISEDAHNAVVDLRPTRVSTGSLMIPAGFAFLAIALVSSPMTEWNRQQHWLTCLRSCFGRPLDSKCKDELAMTPFPRWSELQPLLDRLKQLQVTDKSVLAYNGNLIHFYPHFSFRPPTRFVYVDVLARCFAKRRKQMVDELESSGMQYVISDLIEDGWEGALPEEALLPDEIAQRRRSMFFPYNQTPVFRSGGYVLFQVDSPVGTLTSDYSPLSNLHLLQAMHPATSEAAHTVTRR